MIHQIGITLSEKERFRLERNAHRQDQQIAWLLKARPDQAFTFQEVVDATGFNEASVKRSLSHMAGCDSAPNKYKDDYGRWPLQKLDEKKMNQKTGVRVHCFQWNPRYKKLPCNADLLNKHSGKQMNFHE